MELESGWGPKQQQDSKKAVLLKLLQLKPQNLHLESDRYHFWIKCVTDHHILWNQKKSKSKAIENLQKRVYGLFNLNPAKKRGFRGEFWWRSKEIIDARLWFVLVILYKWSENANSMVLHVWDFQNQLKKQQENHRDCSLVFSERLAP